MLLLVCSPRPQIPWTSQSQLGLGWAVLSEIMQTNFVWMKISPYDAMHGPGLRFANAWIWIDPPDPRQRLRNLKFNRYKSLYDQLADTA